ncbi:hypothetical protein VKT23_017230 [Stygiomarasmius scandens]|uniref:Uncharacterized protein n=1 Tax=Marasmiellus scandens TaxID=2682957 RepID=A0ABR1IUJ7_9AGAR
MCDSQVILHVDPSNNSPPDNRYPHTMQLLRDALSHARKFPDAFQGILSKVSLMNSKICDYHENIAIFRDAEKVVAAFLGKPFHVQLKPLESVDATLAYQKRGLPYLATEIANALEECMNHGTGFGYREQYKLWTLSKQDPILTFKTHLTITFLHQVMHGIISSVYGEQHSPRLADLSIQQPQITWESLKLEGTALLAMDKNVCTNPKLAVRLCYESELVKSKCSAEHNCFLLENDFLITFINTLESQSGHLPAFPQPKLDKMVLRDSTRPDQPDPDEMTGHRLSYISLSSTPSCCSRPQYSTDPKTLIDFKAQFDINDKFWYVPTYRNPIAEIGGYTCILAMNRCGTGGIVE